MNDDVIYRKDAIAALEHNQEVYSHNFHDNPFDSYTIAIIDNDIRTVAELKPAQQTIYGYEIEHLKVIATVLHKEGLSPDRVVEALTDIDSIISMVRAEYEEALRKAVERQIITDKEGEPEQ